MTEAEWDRTDEWRPMWSVLIASAGRDGVRARDRRFRLIACALCRDVWTLLTDEKSRRAVETAEQFADGLSEEARLRSMGSRAWSVWSPGEAVQTDAAGSNGRRGSENGAAFMAAEVTNRRAARAAALAAGSIPAVRASVPDLESIWGVSNLIREVFGNPFRPVGFAPTWRSADVMTLAHAAYETRSLPSGRLERDRLRILADALEDAGCTEAAILSHLRGEGPHIRGCWALDLVSNRA